MTTLNRESFPICMTNDNARAVMVTGYTFDVEMPTGMKWAMGTYKNGNRWVLVDIVTGLTMGITTPTRRECVERAESDEMKASLLRYYLENTETYIAKAEVFRKLVGGETMRYSEYVVTIDEIAAMKREEHRYEDEQPVVDAAAETAVVTLEFMKAKEWPEVLVRQRKEGSCIWVVGNLEGHEDELVELGFKPGRSKHYGRGWWAMPQEA